MKTSVLFVAFFCMALSGNAREKKIEHNVFCFCGTFYGSQQAR